jgi:hypothetical protein
MRDRHLEHVNSGAMVLESSGKYDVSRILSRTLEPRLDGSETEPNRARLYLAGS